jgi:hypothetical protein
MLGIGISEARPGLLSTGKCHLHLSGLHSQDTETLLAPLLHTHEYRPRCHHFLSGTISPQALVSWSIDTKAVPSVQGPGGSSKSHSFLTFPEWNRREWVQRW